MVPATMAIVLVVVTEAAVVVMALLVVTMNVVAIMRVAMSVLAVEGILSGVAVTLVVLDVTRTSTLYGDTRASRKLSLAKSSDFFV